MNFLITGGAGSVGRDLTASLLREGHRVRVLDKQAETVSPLQDKKLEWIQGRLEEVRLVIFGRFLGVINRQSRTAF